MRLLSLVNNKNNNLSVEKYIISSCVIHKNIVLKKNKQFFSGPGNNLQTFLLSLYQYCKPDYPKFYKMDNLSKLGWLASEILIKDESIIKKVMPYEMGIIIENANSSLDTDMKYFQTIDMASPALFVYTLANILIGEICIRNKFTGENACFVFDEFNAGFIEGYVKGLFAHNKVKLCICGWVDVLEENYKAVLFLVSDDKTADALLFQKDTMNMIYKSI
jgi:hypothetical protein